MKLNHPSILATLLVASLLPAQVFAAKPIKPPPEPPPPVTAEDVVCDGCVDTTDIADGAVSAEKLSAILQDRLNQIEAEVANNKPVSVKSNGQIIGRFLGLISDGGTNVNPPSGDFYALSDKSFLFKVISEGRLEGGSQISYESNDCSGQAYIQSGFINDYQAEQGFVRSTPYDQDPIPAYYTPPSHTTVMTVIGSSINEEGCQIAQNSALESYYSIFPNDPAITGVSNPPFATPITLGY